jgi:hypothetical protein
MNTVESVNGKIQCHSLEMSRSKASFLYIIQDQPKCPSTDEWMKKMQCMHTKDYWFMKCDTLFFATTWMRVEDIM